MSGACGSIHSRRVTPTGWRPARTVLSSATALSTPPDIATATRSAAGGRQAPSRAPAIASWSASTASATHSRCVAAGSSACSRSAVPMRAAPSSERPSASSQASSAAATACGQPKARRRAAAIRPSESSSWIRTASPQAGLPASPVPSGRSTSPARRPARARSTTAFEYIDRTLGERAGAEVGQGAAASAARKASTSAAVVPLPIETRITLRVSAAHMPWAIRTWLGSWSADSHAEPAETANPARSSASTSSSARRPATQQQRVARAAARRRPRRRWPPPAGRTPAGRAAPAAGRRTAAPAASAAANPTAPATFSVPERRPPSWPPPQISGGMPAGSRASRQPTPFGPPSLCAETAMCRRPGRRIQGKRRRGLDRVDVQRHPPSRQIAAISAIGWITPVTLFAHITAASRSPGLRRARRTLQRR